MMLLYGKTYSNYECLYEEIDLITDTDVLRAIVKRLLRENRILCRKTNITIQSLDNQNILIGYLQSALSSLINWSKMAADRLCDIFGHELLNKIDDVVRCRTLINNMSRNFVFDDHAGFFKELQEIAACLSLTDIHDAKKRCLVYLKKLDDARSLVKGNQQTETGIAEAVYPLDNCQEEINGGNNVNEKEDVEPTIVYSLPNKKSSKLFKLQNGRIALKKYRSTLHKKKVSAHLTHLPKSRSNRPENRPKKKIYKPSKVSDSIEKSKNSIIETEPEKLSKTKRRYKRRINEVNEENFSNSLENSNLSPEKSPPSKKIRSSLKDSSQNSVDGNIDCRPFCISLVDILNDPAAENNELVAQFKQTYMTKDDENEYEIVDDVDASDEDDKSDNSDDNKSDSGGKEVHEDASHQSSSNENDASDPEHGQKENAPDKSPAKKDDDDDDDDGKKGPRTPPPPSPVALYEIFRRGPCTPPGEGPPDSDSLSVTSGEDDQSNQSTKSETI